ncbi:MAG: arginase [Microbacteriaceae bacterium]|nr:arginase [Microbacteriaceae bacterium]
MPVTFLVVPQWQGSGSSRALRLQDGAEAIRGDLPATSTRTVDVPMEAGDEVASGLPRFGSLRLVRERTLAELETIEGAAITIGGECGVALAAIEHAVGSSDETVAVVWFDAHPDLNTVETSPSGAFSGMVLRTLLGDGVAGLVPDAPLSPEQVVLAGVRSTDDGEQAFLADSGVRSVSVEELADPAPLLAAVAATGATSVYVLVDLDVIDPAELAGVADPVPFGVSALALVQAIRALTTRYPLAGACIAGFSPSSPEAATDDLPTILRVIGALTA